MCDIFPAGCMKITGAQTFSCDASLATPLCPRTVASCTCEVTGTMSQTRWKFSASLCPGGLIALGQTPPCQGRGAPSSRGTCGPFLEASNVMGAGQGYCNTSMLNIRVNLMLGGLDIQCWDMAYLPPRIVGGITLLVVGNVCVWCVHTYIHTYEFMCVCGVIHT